jgi:hypothetical protein
MWTLPDIAIGFFIACLPYLPKFTKYMLNKPIVSRTLRRSTVKVILPGNSRHQRRPREYVGISGFRRPHHPTRMISDVEFDELVARTELSSMGARQEENQKAVIITHEGDRHEGEQWPPGEKTAHEASVWTGRDVSRRPSLDPESGDIVVTTNVSVSRD